MTGEDDDALGAVVCEQLHRHLADHSALAYAGGALPKLLPVVLVGEGCVQTHALLQLIRLELGLHDRHVRLGGPLDNVLVVGLVGEGAVAVLELRQRVLPGDACDLHFRDLLR